MASLEALPPEVVTAILGQLGLEDLAAVRQTSRRLRGCATGNAQLYRRLYLEHFDPPPTALDWEREIRDFERFQSICRSEDPGKLPLVLRVVKRLLQLSPRMAVDADADADADADTQRQRFRNADALSRLLNTPANHAAFFAQSSLYERVRTGGRGDGDGDGDGDDAAAAAATRQARRARHQQAAELHCLLGTVLLVVEEEEEEEDGDQAQAQVAAPKDPAQAVPRRRRAAYPFAMAKVYNLREHSPGSMWGPFVANWSGRVDWEKVEAALVVLRANVRRKGLLKLPVVGAYWNHTFLGSWAHSYVPMLHVPRPAAAAGVAAGADGDGGGGEEGGADSLEAQEDPYGVTGIWLRLVSFLDYSDFFRFNFLFGDSLFGPRSAFQAKEDLRMMAMELRVTGVSAAPGGFPEVDFAGTSHSLDSSWDADANASLRGSVRTTPDGHVRWTVVSVVDGEPRWRSECVQIGGLRSGRGAVGYWFDAGYNPQGPCGPTAFWKLHEHRVPEDALPGGGDPPQPFAYLLDSELFGGSGGGGGGSSSSVLQHHRPNVLGVGGLLMGQEEWEDEEEDDWEDDEEEDNDDEDYVDDVFRAAFADGVGHDPLPALVLDGWEGGWDPDPGDAPSASAAGQAGDSPDP